MRAHEPILVVEDDMPARDAISTLLTTQGFTVCIAKDGQEALDLLQKGIRPSLLIVDVGLPRVSGPDLLKFAHQDPEMRLIPAIIITGGSPDRTDLIADEIFFKPVDVPRLLGSVRRLIRYS